MSTERDVLLASIEKNMMLGAKNHNAYGEATTRTRRMIISCLSEINDVELLRKTDEVCDSLLGRNDSEARDFVTLLTSMEKNEWGEIEQAHTYLQLATRNLSMLGAILIMHKQMTQGGTGLTAEGLVPTMEAHLYASYNFPYKFGLTHHDYVNMPEIILLVQRHADHVELLIRYMTEHGVKQFREKHFVEALKHGALAEGWL